MLKYSLLEKIMVGSYGVADTDAQRVRLDCLEWVLPSGSSQGQS